MCVLIPEGNFNNWELQFIYDHFHKVVGYFVSLSSFDNLKLPMEYLWNLTPDKSICLHAILHTHLGVFVLKPIHGFCRNPKAWD